MRCFSCLARDLHRALDGMWAIVVLCTLLKETRRMNKACFMPLVLVCAMSAGATEPTYNKFLTGVSSVDGSGVPTAVGGSWTHDDTTLSNAGGAVAFDTGDSGTMTLDVSAEPADTNTIVKVELVATLADVGELSDPLSSSKTAFAVCTNAYHAWTGSSWVVLGEVPAGVDDTISTNLTVEISYQGSSARKARFTVGDTVLGGGWVVLTDTASSNLAGIGMSGSGTLAKADASVMLGIAEYDGVKYGTLADAVEEAAKDVTKTIEVLRETNENVTLPDGAKIADNGNVKGVVTVPENASVEVQPKAAEFVSTTGADVGTSGSYTVPVNVSGGTVNVKLPDSMSNKEIVGTPSRSGSTISLTIQTATSVLEGAKPDGAKALNIAEAAKESKLRAYLGKNLKSAYEAADVSASSIGEALAADSGNSLKHYQNYALGIEPEDSVKPVSVPIDDDDDNITLAIPSLSGKTPSGDYTITYKVGDTVQEGGASSIKIPLPAAGAGTSTAVKICFE